MQQRPIVNVEAARRFALQGDGNAYIGALDDAAMILAGKAGTCISTDTSGIVFE